MAKMLLRDLTLQEQLALASLAQHPGFEILTRLMDEACRLKAAEVIRLDPSKADYKTQLEQLALMARATNEFCASIRASVLTHVEAAVVKQHQADAAQVMAEEEERVLTTVRRLAQQDNQ